MIKNSINASTPFKTKTPLPDKMCVLRPVTPSKANYTGTYNMYAGNLIVKQQKKLLASLLVSWLA